MQNYAPPTLSRAERTLPIGPGDAYIYSTHICIQDICLGTQNIPVHMEDEVSGIMRHADGQWKGKGTTFPFEKMTGLEIVDPLCMEVSKDLWEWVAFEEKPVMKRDRLKDFLKERKQ